MGGSSTEEVGAGGSYPVISNVAESESTLNHCVMEKMTDEVASPHGFLQPSRVIGTPPAGRWRFSCTMDNRSDDGLTLYGGQAVNNAVPLPVGPLRSAWYDRCVSNCHITPLCQSRL
jgi:hypothetical protein